MSIASLLYQTRGERGNFGEVKINHEGLSTKWPAKNSPLIKLAEKKEVRGLI